MKTKKILVYSAEWCAFCHAVMDYLDKIGAKYEVKDVENSQQNAMEAVQKSHQMGIPVVDIDGTIIIGFDRPRIDAALKA